MCSRVGPHYTAQCCTNGQNDKEPMLAQRQFATRVMSSLPHCCKPVFGSIWKLKSHPKAVVSMHLFIYLFNLYYTGPS